MALDTYANLQTAIGNWLNRSDSDTIATIPDFIKVAESQMQRRFVSRIKDGLPIPRRMFTLNASFAVTNGAEFISIPADFAGPISFQLPNTPQSIELDYLDDVNLQAEKARAFWTGAPKFYTVVGSNLQLYPVADQAYTATLVYINRFPTLSNSNTANWILTDYPDAYLYGALTASAPYLKDDARAQTWGTLFTAALDDICNADPMPSDKLMLTSELPMLLRPWALRGIYDINTDS